MKRKGWNLPKRSRHRPYNGVSVWAFFLLIRKSSEEEHFHTPCSPILSAEKARKDHYFLNKYIFIGEIKNKLR